MSDQNAPLGELALEDLGDDDVGANEEFMRYIESLDIPVDEDNDMDEVVADLIADDMSSESAHVDVSASGSERPSMRRSRSSSHPLVSLQSRNADDDKLSKMREKNRQAQARFRKRQKVQICLAPLLTLHQPYDVPGVAMSRRFLRCGHTFLFDKRALVASRAGGLGVSVSIWTATAFSPPPPPPCSSTILCFGQIYYVVTDAGMLWLPRAAARAPGPVSIFT